MQASVSSRIIDFTQLERHLGEAGLRALLVSARVLVLQAASKVPVDTGMSRSTWVPLGRYVGTPISVNGTPNSRKNPAKGEAQSDFEFTIAGAIAQFKWSSDVLQYNLNENNHMARVASSPWKSLPSGVQKAKEAFKAEIIPQMQVALKASITHRERIY